MRLLVENSPEDLVLRGFSQDYILRRTGVDVGYHGCYVRKKLSGIDRFQYKVEYVRQHCSNIFLKDVLDKYANCLDKESVLNLCGVAGQNIVKLKQLFEALGLAKEFKKADSLQRKNAMKHGMFDKFGVDNPFKLNCFQEIAAKTREDKYGAKYTLMNESSLCQGARDIFLEHAKDPVFLKQLNDKRRQTTYERYGVDHIMQCEEIRQKVRDVFLQHYGCHPMQTEECQEKIKRTCQEKYGVDNYCQTESFKKKVKQTCQEKYGVDNYFQTDSARQCQSRYMKEHWNEVEPKRKATMQKRYGVNYTWENDELLAKTKLTIADRYGAEHYSQSDEFCERRSEMDEKRKQTCLERYGVDCYLKTDDCKEKSYKSKKQNATFNESMIENYIKDILDLEYQYRDDERYPYFCDFYDKKRDMFIEVNAFWGHGFHWFDDNNVDDIDKLNKWQSKKDVKKIYDKVINTWCVRDVEKRECAYQNKLNYVTLWDSKGADFDLWCAMGCPDGHDYDYVYSWLPKRNIQTDVDVSQFNMTLGNVMSIVKDAQRCVFFEKELKLWEENGFRKNYWGTVQAFLYANRYKYLHKLPDELTDRELLRAFRVSGLYRGYTSFNGALMRKVIENYDVLSVYDPCSGWGERMCICALYGINYEACDINIKLKNGYQKLIDKFDGFEPVLHFNDAATQCIENNVDTVITCPPYRDLEIYSENGAENLDELAFVDWWNSVVERCSVSNAKTFAVQTNQKCRQLFLDGLCKNGWQLVDELTFGNEQKDHFLRKSGKKEFESMLVCQR